MQRNLATKIRAKRESSLTTVQLKQDPPVPAMRAIGGIYAFQIGSLCPEAALWPVAPQGVEIGGGGSPS